MYLSAFETEPLL